MATIATDAAAAPRAKSFAPDMFERVLACASLALLAAVVVALACGQARWPLVPWPVWGIS